MTSLSEFLAHHAKSGGQRSLGRAGLRGRRSRPRRGRADLVPGYYAALSPRLGVAYSPDSKTVIRAAAARSFGRVTALASSSHYAGFIGQYAFTSPNQGIAPAFNWDAGMPPYQLPPQINPSFANNQNVDYWNNNASPPQFL